MHEVFAATYFAANSIYVKFELKVGTYIYF